jgi:acrylyl-CoA reductase (NADPH)
VPKPVRIEAWSHLASELDRGKLATITTTIGFDDILPAARDIAEGKVRGRLVVTID